MDVVSIEIKARCKDANKIRRILKDHNADFKGVDHQVDTYFNTENGRLKLRQGNIENNLIHYQREDKSGPKQSLVTFSAVHDSESLRDVLSKALGILVEVDKRREIYFVDNVKFHIDEVKGLGSFVEIEALDKDGSIGKKDLQKQCQYFVSKFEIKDEDLLSVSYSDLLKNK